VLRQIPGVEKFYPIKGLDWPLGLQEVEAPRIL